MASPQRRRRIQGPTLIRLGLARRRVHRRRTRRRWSAQPPDPPQQHHQRVGLLPLLGPRPATLAQLVRVAGIRWTVEESFQAAKSQVGLDQHQVHRWDSWHRFTTLALAALAVLAICAADAATRETDARTDSGLIRLTINEIRRLVNTCIIRPISDLNHRFHWSQWRRRHQAQARQSHYTRRLNLERPQ
ncbi:transposase [Micromonospora sp. RHAY321]|uniref:transposase n=1 Tax=Micromonospora sp. RHAY321 TaxID=2944807 RepID=UPI0035AD8EDB